LIDFSEVLTDASIRTVIILMMAAIKTSETPVNFEATWCNIPEGYILHQSENLR
jgi:hypothetical protein